MTTAHRPTWTPALASRDQGGNRAIAPSFSYSSRDLPGHKVLKVRQPGQNTLDEINQRNLKEELLLKESVAKRKRLREDQDEDLEDEEPLKKQKPLAIDYSVDADDSASEDEGDSEDSSSSESDDEDEIRKELEKIKAERAAQVAQKAHEEGQIAQQGQRDAAMRQNPLLSSDQEDYSLSKKWYEDVVFKNQTRNQPKQEKRFVNDTVRNDFHRKFLNKYVQ
jgi:protein CWC15